MYGFPSTYLRQEQTADLKMVADAMFAQGIGMSVHYIPLHQQSYWRDSCQLKAEDFPVSEALYQSTASLPIYTRMTDADVRRVAAAVRVALEAQ